MIAKQVKKLIHEKMTNRTEGVSVVLGECDPNYERIEIKYPKTENGYLSLNPITTILKKHNFYVAQIIDFYYDTKRVILLIREPRKTKSRHGFGDEN